MTANILTDHHYVRLASEQPNKRPSIRLVSLYYLYYQPLFKGMAVPRIDDVAVLENTRPVPLYPPRLLTYH